MCGWFGRIAGSARRTGYFLLRRQKKVPKEKATPRLPKPRKKTLRPGASRTSHSLPSNDVKQAGSLKPVRSVFFRRHRGEWGAVVGNEPLFKLPQQPLLVDKPRIVPSFTRLPDGAGNLSQPQ